MSARAAFDRAGLDAPAELFAKKGPQPKLKRLRNRRALSSRATGQEAFRPPSSKRRCRAGYDAPKGGLRPCAACTAIAERANHHQLMMEKSEKNDDRNWNS
jgi:hypothetical protein